MNYQKDRLHRVMVIGANPAGIAATNKLGELGIPVTLIDSETDLDRKLAAEKWRLPSGMPFNHAHRSGLIRILRNPAIRCLLPATPISIKHTLQGFRVDLNIPAPIVDAKRCILCGKCVEVCPVQPADGCKALIYNSRLSLPGRVNIDKRRMPLCQEHCPLGVNVQGYVALAKNGRYAKALALIRKDNVLPGICGRICTHPCESACRRSDVDDPIAIRDIKRFLADYERSHPESVQETDSVPNVPSIDLNIAVVGSGPAGLAAASDMAKMGCQVTVFEKEKEAGGLLRYGIGAHRLPRDILDSELKQIEKLGVSFKTSHAIDLENDLESLKQTFSAIIVTTGIWADKKLGVPGEDLAGVSGCLEFLPRFYAEQKQLVNDNIAVIGDGNAAFDLARTLVRTGAKVTLLSWFPEDHIPADSEEVTAAVEEGVDIRYSVKTVGFSGINGKMNRVICKPTQPGDPDENGIAWPVIVSDSGTEEMAFDRAFVAIGQKSPLTISSNRRLKTTAFGYIDVDNCLRTNVAHVYAAGDAVTGASTVVEAMASGRMAASSIYQDMIQEDAKQGADRSGSRPRQKDFPEIPSNIQPQKRMDMPEKQPDTRRRSFEEVALGVDEAHVIAESQRCLQCGVCSECLQCIDACGNIRAINHDTCIDQRVEQTGVIIMADSAYSDAIKGEDVVRAYGPSNAKDGVYAQILRGFSAAAKTMKLLGAESQGTKGRGMSFAPPDPGLSDEIRIGVFACKCNTSLGWLDDMDAYIGSLKERDDIVHAEVLISACVPEGANAIVRTIREKGITRVVLASCVCCPLNFICSACTDQRSRLKDALFRGTGISRSMVETCNLRGEVLRLTSSDPDLALKRFTGLIERSIMRTRHLKAFPTPIRNYNFASAVIGKSEAALTSALMLAESGLDVFWFRSAESEGKKQAQHPNIYPFIYSKIKGINGTIGDFRITFDIDGVEQYMEAGVVIMGEKSRKKIPYISQPGIGGTIVSAEMQIQGRTGTPFFYPGQTTIPGLFLADPPSIGISDRQKGEAAAIKATTVIPRGPRQSRGFTVEIDSSRCRGCGRCLIECGYHAIRLCENTIGGWFAVVDEAICKGCGNCISVCPTNAADSPYRDRAFLEQAIEFVLEQ